MEEEGNQPMQMKEEEEVIDLVSDEKLETEAFRPIHDGGEAQASNTFGDEGHKMEYQFCRKKCCAMQAPATHLGLHGRRLKNKWGRCGNKMKNAGQVRQHQAIHKDRPYSCSVCGKKYIRKRNLIRHCQINPHKGLESEKVGLENVSAQLEVAGGILGEGYHETFTPNQTSSDEVSLQEITLPFWNDFEATSTQTTASTQKNRPEYETRSNLFYGGALEMPHMQRVSSHGMNQGFLMPSVGTSFGNIYSVPQYTSGLSSFIPGAVTVSQESMQAMNFQVSPFPQQYVESSAVTYSQYSGQLKDRHSGNISRCPKCSEAMMSPLHLLYHYDECRKNEVVCRQEIHCSC